MQIVIINKMNPIIPTKIQSNKLSSALLAPSPSVPLFLLKGAHLPRSIWSNSLPYSVQLSTHVLLNSSFIKYVPTRHERHSSLFSHVKHFESHSLHVLSIK